MCIRDRLAAGGVVLDDERGHVGIERHAEEHGGGQQREENSGRDDPLVVRDDETRDPIHHALQLFVLGDAMPLAATAARLTEAEASAIARLPSAGGRRDVASPSRADAASTGRGDPASPAREAILRELNEQQRAAVLHGDEPLLIIAGAGTGKTTTLANRVAYQIAGGVNPARILLLTFTRRAAAEMLRRRSGRPHGW